MNNDIIQGKWTEVKGKIKQQWGKFTDDDITRMKGSYEELRGNIQKKYGYQQEQAEKEIHSFIQKNGWNN